MVGVDVRGYLEDKARELLLLWLHLTLLRLGGSRARCNLYETVEQFLYTEIVECTAEENRCHRGGSVVLDIESGIDALNEFEVNIFSMVFSRALYYLPERGNEMSGLMIMGLIGGTIFPLLMGVLSDAMGSQAGSVIVISMGVAYLVYLASQFLKKA